MGNYLKQINASKGLLNASRFSVMYDVALELANNARWDSYGTAKDIRSSHDFRDVCHVMGVRLIPEGGDSFTVDVDGAYDSALFIPLAEALAPYINDGSVVVRIGESPFVTSVVFEDGKVSVSEEEAEFKTIAVRKTNSSEKSEGDRLQARYQKAVDAVGGEEAIEKLPQYFKDRLSEQCGTEEKIGILEAIAELKAMA